jgi:hypothetical protein
MLGSIALLVAAQAVTDPGAVKARQTAYARIATAEAVARDPELLRAIKAKNQAGESGVEIQNKDRQWQANPRYPLRQELTNNACASRLKKLVGTDAIVVEAFLMDARGALVCATRETSDYWQGDEAKWTKTYRDGKQVFVDDPALDLSSNTYAAQLSLLVSEGETKIGALTLTLKVPR